MSQYLGSRGVLITGLGTFLRIQPGQTDGSTNLAGKARNVLHLAGIHPWFTR